MTSPAVVTLNHSGKPLWSAAIAKANSASHSANSENKDCPNQRAADIGGLPGNASLSQALSPQAGQSQNIQLAPFRDRLTLRRQCYVPLGDRSPLQTLAPLFAGGQLEQVAMGQWCAATKANEGDETGTSSGQWVLARLVELDQSSPDTEAPSAQSPQSVQLLPYLYIGMTSAGDLGLRLLPAAHYFGGELALSTLDGVGREFKISAQTSFIQRIAQLQEMQLELGQEFAIRSSLYNSLRKVKLRPSQALRYFDRLLDESPYPPSQTPASDRLIQRRQLFKTFSTHPEPTLWDAYVAVAHWVNNSAPGNAAQRWHSCCHGAGATMLRQALAYAVALQYDQQEAESAQQPRISGAQRSLAASDALQARIQQLRDDEAIARQPQISSSANR